MKAAAARLAVVAAVAGGACDLEPDVGPAIAERCSNADSDPETVVRFSADLLPILHREVAGCYPCHDPSEDDAVGFRNGGLDLSTYATARRGGFNSSQTIIVPGAPCSSMLYLKVSPGPPFGSRMPFDGPPYLTGLELRLVHDWIAEGAKEN